MKKAEKTLKLLAVSNDRQNRTRSILIMISIVLTTMLLTIIGLVVNTGIQSNRVNADIEYGKFCGSFSGVNENQIETMRLRSEFTEIGLQGFVASVKTEDATLVLYYTDATVLDMMNADLMLEEGHYPTGMNEITAPKGFFQELGMQNPELGDTIVLDSRIDNQHKYESSEFIIAGFTSANKTAELKAAYGAFVSQEYFQERIPQEDRRYTAYFNVNESVGITASNGEETVKELATLCGIDPDVANENYAYLFWKLNPGWDVIAGGVLIGCVAILFSSLVLYNIFQVGITQKIQEYGKIKAIGATRKQLRKIILKEGMYLTIGAIPFGLFLGYVISYLVFRWEERYIESASQLKAYQEIPVFSWSIFLLVIGLVLLTVYLSLRRPMKIVASVSPIEAIRFQESMAAKQGFRRGKKYLNVMSLTLSNLKLNKKRTITTITTMGLSCVLFVILANITGNMDISYQARQEVEYGQFCVSIDYSLNDTAYPENNLNKIQEENPINDAFIAQVKEIHGVTEVKTRDVLCIRNPKVENEFMSVAVLNREEFRKYYQDSSHIGKLDYDEISETDGIVYGYVYGMEEAGYCIGDELNLKIQLGDSEVSMETMVYGSIGCIDQNWVMTEDTFQKLNLEGDFRTYLWVDCKEEDCEEVEEALNELTKSQSMLAIESYSESFEVWKLTMQVMQFAVDAFLGILGIIGFMNLANTMITSIITRKHELGILQAIGMTNNQLSRMLQMEGLIFTIGTVLVAVGIGSPVGYYVFLVAKKKGIIGLNIYHFPWIEILCMVLIIAVLQIILSYVLSRNLRKESLVERISYLG